MEFRTTSTRANKAGFSVIEMMIGVGIAGIALAIIGISWSMIVAGFDAIENYTELEQNSRHALDLMGRDIRQADSLLVLTDDSFTLLDSDAGEILYSYTASSKTFSRTAEGSTQQLLTDCEDFLVDIYQRNTMSGTYDQYPTADPDTCKLIQVSWKCARRNMNGTENTELVQSAKFVIRKK